MTASQDDGQAGDQSAAANTGSRGGFTADLGAVVVLGSAAAYALGWAAQDAFFGAFGLTPDEVGVDKLAALLRILPLAVIFAVGLAVVFTFAIAFGGLIYDSLARACEPAPSWLRRFAAWLRGRVPLLVAVPIVGAALVAAMALMGMWPRDAAADAGITVLICWMLTAMVWLVFRDVWGKRTASAAAAAAVVVLAGMLLYGWLPTGADALRSSGVLPERLNVVGIRSGYVDVRWFDSGRRPPELIDNPAGAAIAPPPQTSLPRLLIVLNQSGGTYTLWDCVAARIYTVRDNEAAVVRIVPLPGDSVGAWTGCGTLVRK